MSAGPAFWWHWKRGAVILLVIALTLAGAAVVGSMLIGIVFAFLELFMSENSRISFEDTYMIPCIVIIALLIAPPALSESWERMGFDFDGFPARKDQ